MTCKRPLHRQKDERSSSLFSKKLLLTYIYLEIFASTPACTYRRIMSNLSTRNMQKESIFNIYYIILYYIIFNLCLGPVLDTDLQIKIEIVEELVHNSLKMKNSFITWIFTVR